MSKTMQLNDLYGQYIKQFQGKEIVLGDGNPDTLLMLVGEAPGKDEVKQSKPFVGAAGKNLSEFLEILGVKREDIYITNAIKYRLSKINEATGRVVNRPAGKREVEGSQEYLWKEIGIIKPQYVVTLGNVPLKAVSGDKQIQIGEVHGLLRKIQVLNHEYTLFPLYHPASTIYNQALKTVYIEDIKGLKKIINP